MVKMNHFIFGNTNSKNYNVYISSGAAYNAPARVYDMVEVPGRNGSVALDGGRFENIEVTYPAFTFGKDQDEFARNVRTIRNVLQGYKGYTKLWDTYNPDEYRMAIFKEGLETEGESYNRAGKFDLVFDAKPQRFLTSGDESIDWTSSGTLENPTPFEALPNLLVYGSGQLTIEGNTITVGSSQSRIVTIDSEVMECYEIVGSGLVPLNSAVSFSTGEFPVLQPGLNHITLGSGITQVKIVPHWWVI